MQFINTLSVMDINKLLFVTLPDPTAFRCTERLNKLCLSLFTSNTISGIFHPITAGEIRNIFTRTEVNHAQKS